MTTYDQIIQKGEQIGMQKGIKKGQKDGIIEEKTRVVLKSYDNNVDMNTICVITSLTMYEVEALLKAHDRL